jgi:hypothetical protein
MTAYNVVRFRVKPGKEKAFEDAHRIDPGFKGFKGGALVKTGDHAYCFVGSWDNFESLTGAREKMIGILNTFRDILEDLGGGLGVTDPISGEAVVELPASKG